MHLYNLTSKKFFSKLIFISFLIFSLLLNGCKVKYTFTGASISPDVKTVSVDYFQNLSSIVNPKLSNILTEEIKNRFVSQTSLNLTNSFGDLQFSGQITSYNVAPIAIQGNETAARNRLSITVKVKFVNTKDNKYNYDRSFTQYEDFDSNQSFTQLEDGLVALIVDKLVEDIFVNAVANW